MSDPNTDLPYIAYPRGPLSPDNEAARKLFVLRSGFNGLLLTFVVHAPMAIPLIMPHRPGEDVVTGKPLHVDVLVLALVFVLYYGPLRKVRKAMGWGHAVPILYAGLAALASFFVYAYPKWWNPTDLIWFCGAIFGYCYLLRRILFAAITSHGIDIQPSVFSPKEFQGAVEKRFQGRAEPSPLSSFAPETSTQASTNEEKSHRLTP